MGMASSLLDGAEQVTILHARLNGLLEASGPLTLKRDGFWSNPDASVTLERSVDPYKQWKLVGFPSATQKFTLNFPVQWTAAVSIPPSPTGPIGLGSFSWTPYEGSQSPANVEFEIDA